MSEEMTTGEVKVDLGFDFEFSRNGELDLANTIILRAPSMHNLEIENKMMSFVYQGFAGLKGNRPADMEPEEENKPPLTAEAREELKKEIHKAALQSLGMGMSSKMYNEFILYVKKVLTANPAIACIADANGVRTELGISDLVWKQFQDKEGLKPFYKLAGHFVCFFMDALIPEVEESPEIIGAN